MSKEDGAILAENKNQFKLYKKTFVFLISVLKILIRKNDKGL